jgi:hypothetical protein
MGLRLAGAWICCRSAKTMPRRSAYRPVSCAGPASGWSPWSFAAQVAVSGGIGFVGLVITHLARMLVGAEHGRLLPASMLAGGLFMLGLDDIARTAASAEIPIGLLNSFVGAPVFAVLFWPFRAGGITVVFSSHQPQHVLAVADRVMLMQDIDRHECRTRRGTAQRRQIDGAVRRTDATPRVRARGSGC